MRSKNAIQNSAFALIQKLLEIFLSFAFRTALIYTLGKLYLGLSGLFTNIFSLLSLMELGVSSSIVFLLYKPLKEKDDELLKSLLKVYATYYKFLGIFVLVVGIGLIPFLPSIIKEYDSIQINLLPIYLLTLLNTVLSYFLAYRRSLLEADQKAYINSQNYSVFNIIGTVLRILALLLFRSYNLTLVITLLCTIISNLIIYVKTDKLYPFLKDKKVKKLSKSKTKELLKRMGAASIHQFGNIVVTSTDNIIISAFIGVLIVGVYSNYTMITNIIYSTFSLIFISITANIGNMKLEKSAKESQVVFNNLLFLNFCLYFVACSIFFALISNFIKLWVGQEYLFNNWIAFLITISLYILGMRNTVVTFVNSSGLNYNTRYKALVEAILNLVISIVLVKIIGISGVVLGTIVSYILVSVWFEPYILFKHWFKEGLAKYYFTYFKYIFLTVITMLIMNIVIKKISCTNYIVLILEGIGCLLFVGIIILTIFGRTEQFKYFVNLIKNNIPDRFRKKEVK